jgi:hypothetical protein
MPDSVLAEASVAFTSAQDIWGTFSEICWRTKKTFADQMLVLKMMVTTNFAALTDMQFVTFCVR